MAVLAGVVAHVLLHLSEAAATSKHTRATIETKLQQLGAAVSSRLASARVTHVVLVRDPPNGTVTAARATEDLWQLFQKLDKAHVPPPPPEVLHSSVALTPLPSPRPRLLPGGNVWLAAGLLGGRLRGVAAVGAGMRFQPFQGSREKFLDTATKDQSVAALVVHAGLRIRCFSVLYPALLRASHAGAFAAWRCGSTCTAGKKRTPQMVPRRATEVELDINLFSSSQIMRDGMEPEGVLQLCHPGLTGGIKAGLLPFHDCFLPMCCIVCGATQWSCFTQAGRSAAVQQCNCHRWASARPRRRRHQRGDSHLQVRTWHHPGHGRRRRAQHCALSSGSSAWWRVGDRRRPSASGAAQSRAVQSRSHSGCQTALRRPSSRADGRAERRWLRSRMAFSQRPARWQVQAQRGARFATALCSKTPRRQAA